MASFPPSVDGQEEIFRLLSDPATFGVAAVRRLDTHGASVFLAGDRVIKVKRAVRYPFLDYSTLAKREAACQAELEVNRNFAPQLYRGVIAITREPGGSLKLGGAGDPVEWAVEMARFDENDTLDHRADRGELDDDLIGKLAPAVAGMHERAQPAEPEAWIAALAGFIADNTDTFRKHGELFSSRSVAALDRDSQASLDRLRPLLRARGAAGLIRRGHGDLHLGNIAVLGGEPVAFDALEFDPVIAAGDVLYDLAFLLMDLIERDLRPAANAVLNGYFKAARREQDYDGIAALPFFMALRAAIRAKVSLVRLDLEAAESRRRETAEAAKRYFDLARQLLAPAAATVVCIGGLSGTGKSLLARRLAPTFPPAPGALVLRSDVERKAFYGVAEHSRLPPEAYRAEVSVEIYRRLNDKAARVARAGYSVIVDAVFAEAGERAAIEAVAAEAGVAFRGMFLTTNLETRLARIGGRGADASDADAAVARRQAEFDTGTIAWPIVDASGSPDRTARAALAVTRGA